jgi:uncharacterized coiled-coil protein SlyX
VRYDAVNAMLLNEFLKEHRKVEQQDRGLEQQEATIAKQQKQIEALTADLQKVSAQIEASKPAPLMPPKQSIKLRGSLLQHCAQQRQKTGRGIRPFRRHFATEL